MWMNDHWCPSRSRKPRIYMKPWSSGSPTSCAPAASAFSVSSSTCSRLSAEKPTRTSLLFAVSATSCGPMKVSKNGSITSMTEASALRIMRVAFSSVNCGSNSKPMLVKNSVDVARFFTGRLMNVSLGIEAPFSVVSSFPV